MKTIISNSEKSGDVTSCDWIPNARLMCRVYGMARAADGDLIPYSRMFALNDDGSDPQHISERRSTRARGFNQDGGTIVSMPRAMRGTS